MRSVLKTLKDVCVILFLTMVFLESLLQFNLLSLPQPILVNMPQYPLRYGIQFDTPHGAREYPANRQETISMTQSTGDLFTLTCLSPDNAPESEPYTVQYTRDEHGFRNPSGWSNDDDTVDLVLVGDSFTAAETIQNPYWENLRNSQLVFGLPGSGTFEQVRLLEAFGLPREPRTVIIAYFGGNDLTDNIRFEAAQEAGLDLHTYGTQNLYLHEYLATFQTAMFVRNSFKQDDVSSCPFPVITTNNIPISVYPPFLEFGTVTSDKLANSVWLTRTTNLLAETASETERLIVLYIPHKAEVYWHLLDDTARINIATTLTAQTLIEDTFVSVDDLSPEEIVSRFTANMDAQRTLLSQHAADNNYEFYDLTPGLRAAASRGTQLYFFGDTHWNQTGHTIVHDLLLNFLRNVP